MLFRNALLFANDDSQTAFGTAEDVDSVVEVLKIELHSAFFGFPLADGSSVEVHQNKHVGMLVLSFDNQATSSGVGVGLELGGLHSVDAFVLDEGGFDVGTLYHSMFEGWNFALLN